MDPNQRRAKRPVTVLAGAYGHPVHPALVHLPVGAWLSSLAFDLVSHAVSGGDAAFAARAATWLLWVGLLGAAAAAVAGFVDLLCIAPGTGAWRTAVRHVSLALLGSCVLLVDALLRRGAAPGATAVGPLVLTVVGLLTAAGGAMFGGDLVFRHGVRVVEDRDQAAGFVPLDPPGGTTEPAPGPDTGAARPARPHTSEGD